MKKSALILLILVSALGWPYAAFVSRREASGPERERIRHISTKISFRNESKFDLRFETAILGRTSGGYILQPDQEVRGEFLLQPGSPIGGDYYAFYLTEYFKHTKTGSGRLVCIGYFPVEEARRLSKDQLIRVTAKDDQVTIDVSGRVFSVDYLRSPRSLAAHSEVEQSKELSSLGSGSESGEERLRLRGLR